MIFSKDCVLSFLVCARRRYRVFCKNGFVEAVLSPIRIRYYKLVRFSADHKNAVLLDLKYCAPSFNFFLNVFFS